MKMRTLSKKTLALFLTMAMLVSCMVWAGASAVSADYTVFTCNFDTQPVKSSYANEPNKAAGYTPDSGTSGDNTVHDANNGIKYRLSGGVGYMELRHNGSNSKGVAFRLYGDKNSWKTTIDGTTVVSNADKSRAKSGIRYRITFKYKVTEATTDVYLYQAVVGGALSGAPYGISSISSAQDTLVIEAGVTHDEWQTHTAIFKAPSNNAWVMGLMKNSGTAGQVTVLVDDIIMEYVPDSRLATYTLDDNMGGTTTFTAVQDDPASTLPAPTKGGMNFLGWYTDAECTTPFTDATLTAGAHTLYAGWEASSTTAYIAFDCGDVDASVATLSGDAGATVTLPAGPVVADGSYRFVRWEDAQGNPVTQYTFPAAGETATVKAVWTPLVRHEYYYNDGTTTYVLQSIYAGDNMTFPTVPLRSEKYVLTGWNTAADGTGEAYTTDTIAGTETVKLYAQWTYTYVEEHNDNYHKAFFDKYKGDTGLGNNGDGYAKVPANGDRAGIVAGNGSGVILSYLHNYDVATGTDVPGTAADGGYSVAIHLSGNNYETNPKHVITMNGAKVPVVRGYGYTVKFMVYVDEDMTLPFTLGTVPTGNFNFNNIGQPYFYEELGNNSSFTVDVTGGQWQEVTMEVPAIKAQGMISTFKDGDIYLYLGLCDRTSNVYVHVDHVTVYEHKAIETNTMNFENLDVGTSLNLVGECSAVVSADQNTTDGGSKSLHVNSHWGGANRAQFLITDAYGKPIVVEEGASYRITLRVLVPDHVYNYPTQTWFAAAGATQKFTSGGDKSKYSLRVDTATSTALGDFEYKSNAAVPANTSEFKNWLIGGGYVWKNYTCILNSVTLTEESKATERYLRFGIGYASSVAHAYYLDDITVQEIEATPTLSQNTMGFENLAKGTDVEIRKNYHQAVVSTDYSRTGNNSVKITSSFTQTGNIRAQMVLRDEQGNPIRVTPGQKYTMSYYVYFTDTDWNPGLFTWLACSTDGAGITSSGDKDANKLYEYNYIPYDFDKGYEVDEVPQTMYHNWQKISYTFTANNANLTEESYLILGIAHLPRRGDQVPGTGAGSYEKAVSFYLDDLTVTPYAVGMASIDRVNRGYQYVAGSEQGSSSIEGTPGSAIYVQGGVEKTAFRVGATYKCGSSFNTVKIPTGYQKVDNNNVITYQEYEIVERGLLLAKKDTLAGRELTVDTTKAQGLAGKVQTTSNFDKYWSYSEGDSLVTFTVLVKGVTKAIKDTEFVARSYVKAIVEGREYYVYGDVSNPFSSQSIYNATDKTATWFTEDSAAE